MPFPPRKPPSDDADSVELADLVPPETAAKLSGQLPATKHGVRPPKARRPRLSTHHVPMPHLGAKAGR